MKSFVLLLLTACGHLAGGVHLLNTPGATTGPSSNATELPVAVVMFDRNYVKMFDCFIRYWARQITDHQHADKLDVVVYDRAAYEHAQKVVRTYPEGTVRHVQLIEIDLSIRQLRRAASHANTSYSSLIYQAYFWRAIQERLEMGEDVLHMDLDDIVVGDAWAPLASNDPSADIVGPPALNNEIGQQYILYRNTPATKELVGHFWSRWEEWIAACKRKGMQRPPVKAEQPALGAYVAQHNKGGWNRTAAPFVCKMHTGRTLKWDLPWTMRGLRQHGSCKYPEGCRAEGAHVCHGRIHMDLYCEPGEKDEHR